MLTSLHIKNIAVIDEVHIDFTEGFNVLTGETGAGKSIIIDAINMVLGQRTSRELIRTGAQKAVVEAIFFINDTEILARLSEMGIEAEDGGLLIYRDLSVDGRGNARINGMLATAGMLKEASKHLINIHGQQDNQSLLSPASHLEYLDSFARCTQLRAQYKEAYDKAAAIEKQIQNAAMDESEKAQRIDILQYQISEINSARLKADEERQLTERRDFLGGVGEITAAVENARSVLYGGDGDAPSVHDMLSGVVSEFSHVARYDDTLSQFHNTLAAISIDLDDVIDQIRDYAEAFDFSPDELDRIESRLDVIHSLKRKYGKSVEEILAYAAEKQEELERITQNAEYIAGLQKALDAALDVQCSLAGQLTEIRTSAAKTLSDKISSVLQELDMHKVSFRVDIAKGRYTSAGCDDVEFLISANVGEPPKPLSRIASGGEMSRIMLAIKTILSDDDSVPTLIFDEIDTGVSGRAAQKIAQKLFALSRKKQVLCITHLAQIASMARTHFLIEKGMTDTATTTDVLPLSGDDRVAELARIIGGTHITGLTLQNAREILQLAEEYQVGSSG